MAEAERNFVRGNKKREDSGNPVNRPPPFPLVAEGSGSAAILGERQVSCVELERVELYRSCGKKPSRNGVA